MSRIAFSLFLTVLGTHYGYEPATQFGGKAAAWFYVFRGFEGMILFLLLMALLSARSRPRDFGAVAACVWGAIEEGLTAACRLGVGVTNPPADRSQCDSITGLPIYATTLVVVLWALIHLRDR